MRRALLLRVCAAVLVVVHTPFGALAATVAVPPASSPQHASRHPALAAPSLLPASSQHILQSSTRIRIPDGACAFRAYEIQACNATAGRLPPSTTTYIQVNTVFGADGDVAADVAALRPRGSYNSYQRLALHKRFEVARLEGKSFTIELSDGDVLEFGYGKLKWSERDEMVERGRAWCELGDWVGTEQWTCAKDRIRGNRMRKMTCGFPCGHQDMMELR